LKVISRRDFLAGATVAGAAVSGTRYISATQQAPAAPRAVALSHFATPADADFPKVGGNLGHHNYSSLSGVREESMIYVGQVLDCATN
jgi:hypothetical protein